MRRSLTITPENDKKILITKGIFLSGETPTDIDYTTMINIFVEIGLKVFELSRENGNNTQVTLPKEEVFNIFKKHVLSPELKEEAIKDQFSEIFYAKLLEKSQKTETESTKQKPVPELPSQKSGSIKIKAPDYVT